MCVTFKNVLNALFFYYYALIVFRAHYFIYKKLNLMTNSQIVFCYLLMCDVTLIGTVHIAFLC